MKVLLAHGSPAAAHAAQVRTLASDVSAILGEEVCSAFLSDESLPEGAQVLPLFLGAGKHVMEDVPAMAAASNCTLLAPLSDHAADFSAMAYDHLTRESKRVNILFALYRFAGFEAVAAALHAQNKRCSLVATGSMHSEPSITSVLNLWQRDEIGAVTVQPMLLFDGHTLARLRQMIDASFATDVTLAPVLSSYDGFTALIANCLKESV
ncbi:sirohydrochlorin chelatase [Mariprofundus ferrooxydans]|uniref:sirohydrochlorin chelatase n=1 Tax=Mariprofundus ferrooxydans TaxID=314344 RepID=UPI000378F344|nr:hypothetical protein [Mariprofundus ferrooxydans]